VAHRTPILTSRAASLLLCIVSLSVAGSSWGGCPFNPTQHSALPLTATKDGMIFIRHLLGGLEATSAQSVSEYVEDNTAALDIDGDTRFTLTDAQIIIRYLMGFRGNALKSGLPVQPNSTRLNGDDYQTFIDNGCTTDARKIVWNRFSRSLASGDIAAAKFQLTASALIKYGEAIDALVPELPSLIQNLSEPILLIENDSYAEYWTSLPDEESGLTERFVHVIVFVFNRVDGSWKIDAL
jgi:hypothetical protein